VLTVRHARVALGLYIFRVHELQPKLRMLRLKALNLNGGLPKSA